MIFARNNTFRRLGIFLVATLLGGITLVWFVPVSYAETSRPPEVMVGQTTLTQTAADGTSTTYYGGFTGNEAVFNSVPTFQANVGFNSAPLLSGLGCLINIVSCFQLDLESTSSNSGIKIMTSRTYVGANPKMETAALFYPSGMINGDAFSGNNADNYLSNFAFWGRSLAQSGSGSTSRDNSASWSVPNYTLGQSAQSTWNLQQFQDYESKLNTQIKEAMEIQMGQLASDTWQLQSKDLANFNTGSSIDSAAEGKFWYFKNNLTIKNRSNIQYKGKGTIFVDGNLTISDSTIMPPPNDTTSSLGFIVKGDVYLEDNTTIRAPILAMGTNGINGTIHLENAGNLNLNGSFVANMFTTPKTGSNVHFNYDYRFSKDWPPGFRFLAQ